LRLATLVRVFVRRGGEGRFVHLARINAHTHTHTHTVTSLNSEWAHKDLSNVSNWPGPLGFDPLRHTAVTINQVRALWRDKPRKYMYV
jgi:hypothetical protein